MVAPPTANPTTSDARPEQEKLFEAYLDEHPHSTVVQIRDGIEHGAGIRVERVQARIDRTAVHKGTGDYGRVVHPLGGPTRKVKALGFETWILVVDGVVTLNVREQATDLDDADLAALQTAVCEALTRCLRARGVPFVERVAADLDLLGGEDEDDGVWLTTLTAYQDDEE